MSTVSIIKKGSFRGDNMEEKEMDPTGITRIVKISIYHSNDYFCGLTVYFERDDTTQCTDLWGGPYGKLTEVILETNEYITSVNGIVSHDNGVCYVRSLVLKTNLNVYGPYGNQYGEYFEFSALDGHIIGFHGYCTKVWVNALGVYVRQSNGTIIKKGPFLGSGGVVKHMHPTGITRITKITIYHSDKIHGLTVYFERYGTTQCTDLWGRNEGMLNEINLKANEYIKFVKGYRDRLYPYILKSLVLQTNLDVYGPYGKEEGKSFEHTSSLHGQIIGFFALVGSNNVFRVGVYVKGPISKSVLCGGSGGSTRDMDPMFAVSPIEKVVFAIAILLTLFSVCYKFKDYTTESTSLWGGETGVLTEINFEEHEYIKSVRGYVGYFSDIFIVRSLQLITNLKNYGPYGKEEGTPFELSAFDGEIIGFHGRSGAYLDAIGVYVRALWPDKPDSE